MPIVRRPEGFGPPPSRPTVWERKLALAKFPYVQLMDEPHEGGCEAMTAASNRNRKCRIASCFLYQPVGSSTWHELCWEHTFSRGISRWPEDQARFDKWVKKNPPPWRTDNA